MTKKLLGLMLVASCGLLVALAPKLSATSAPETDQGMKADQGLPDCYADTKGPSAPTLCE